METEALGEAIREAAYLEGDFVLRSGKRSSYYLEKFRFGTRPELLGPLGAAIAAAVAECEPKAVRMVERYPTCLLGYSTKVWTRQSPNQEEGFDEAGVHSEGRNEERPVEPRRDQGRRRLHGVGNRDAEERRLGQLHRLRKVLGRR